MQGPEAQPSAQYGAGTLFTSHMSTLSPRAELCPVQARQLRALLLFLLHMA